MQQTFSTLPSVTYPGRLDPNGVLLDCFCEPLLCQCLIPGDVLDDCGLCTPPAQAGRNCTCTPASAAAGLCIPCRISSSTSTDSIRLCHPVIPGVYELIDVSKCNVREQFLTFPTTTYPGYFGVDAQGRPLALDCFCQPPTITTTTVTTLAPTTTTTPATIASTTTSATTTTTSAQTTVSTSIAPTTTPTPSYCLNITQPCNSNGNGGTRIDANGVYCVPTSNSTLFLRIGCNSFGTGFQTWSCPMGCDNTMACFEDSAIADSLGLSAYNGQLGLGVCASGGIFPLLPDPAQMRCVPGTCVAQTPVTTTPAQTPLPEACLSVRAGCSGTGSELADPTTGVYCSTISGFPQQYSLRMTCDISGGVNVALCIVADCSSNCTASPVILALLGLDTINTTAPGTCSSSVVAIPGVQSASAFLSCLATCPTTTISTTAAPTTTTPAATTPPVTLPPLQPPVNQVPPTVIITSPTPSPSVPSESDQTGLLAIVGVPSAVLLAAAFILGSQLERHATPQYYAQRI